MKVLGVEKGTGLVTHGGVKRKLGSAHGRIYRLTNGVGGHSLNWLYLPTPMVGARDRGIVGNTHRGLGRRTASMGGNDD